MKTLSILTGTPEWHAHRDNPAVLNASEASAMMGTSNYTSRADLIRQHATGIRPEVDAATQARFDRGHEIEHLALPFAEEYIGDDLSPVIGVLEVDGLTLSASFDGISFNHETTWECKSWNEKKAEYVRTGQVPPEDYWQVVQQLVVSGAKRTIYTLSDGTLERTIHTHMSLKEADRKRLIAGWHQFVQDVADYQHVESKPEAVAEHIESLPALMIQVEGRVLATNLDKFKTAATTFIANINTDLQTDNDFATADKMVKFLADGEKQLAQVKQHAQAQASDIDAVFRAIDDISAQMRDKRLALDKLVKLEKEARRAEIVVEAQQALMEHRAKLTERIGGNWLPPINHAVFAEAIKGLKTLDSMRDKVSTALARAKIEANEIADRIQVNLTTLEASVDYKFLFPDVAQIIVKPNGDFMDTVNARIATHKAAEAERAEAHRIAQEKQLELERERIRKEEEAKAVAKAGAAQRDPNEGVPTTVSLPAYAVCEQHTPATTDQAVMDAEGDIREFVEARYTEKQRGLVRAGIVEFLKAYGYTKPAKMKVAA